mgnify:CR=1 FL=1
MNKKTKVVWITGASSGIGEALAKAYSKLGTQLILSSRRKSILERVKSECANPEKIEILPFDLNDFEAAPKLVKSACNMFGGIDILINNAGISQRSLIVNSNFEVYKKLIDTDYLGHIALSRAILPYFIEQGGGSYVVVSSVMGKYSSPYRSGYAAAKHALHGFFDAMRMEHQKDNINVTMICPGFVKTPIAKNALSGNGAPVGDDIPLKRRGMEVELLAKKIIIAVKQKKWEVSFGGKERLGVYLKRISNRLLHKIVIRSSVT